MKHLKRRSPRTEGLEAGTAAATRGWRASERLTATPGPIVGRKARTAVVTSTRTLVWETGGYGAAKHGFEIEYPKFTHPSVSVTQLNSLPGLEASERAHGRGGYRGRELGRDASGETRDVTIG